MPGTIAEWYGFDVQDHSAAAQDAALHHTCPFVPSNCTKVGGVCSVRPAGQIITVCPKRLYFDNHRILREIAQMAFESVEVNRDADGLPTLVAGDLAKRTAAATGNGQVGVFGHGFAGEIKLPEAMPGGARYSVDFTLVVVSATGRLTAFAPVEVQTIDTTGSYKPSISSLENGRRISTSDFGMNWENVNKRILPQLIVKGLMLQGERLCTTGIYFVSPEPVFRRIMMRLGNMNRLRLIPKQPGSITFLQLQQDVLHKQIGSPMPLRMTEPITISTSDMSLAFISPENLPPAGSYEEIISRKIR